MKITWTDNDNAVVLQNPMRIVFMEGSTCNTCVANGNALCSLLVRNCMAKTRDDGREGCFREVKD
jgi:hypothetical protein